MYFFVIFVVQIDPKSMFQRPKIILGLVIILTIAFLMFQVFGLDMLSEFARFSIVPLLTYLYFLRTGDSRSYFFWFLAIYGIGEALGGIGMLYYVTEYDLIDYLQFYGGNICYITAYFCLFLEVFKNVGLKKIFKRYPIHLIVLLIFDIYSVVLVSQVTLSTGYVIGLFDAIIEVVYNTVVMLLLTITLINYISYDTKKAMNLLIGAICIVFSEVIQVAYFYITGENILGIVYSVLYVIAFILFYLQSSMSYARVQKFHTLKKLEEA